MDPTGAVETLTSSILGAVIVLMSVAIVFMWSHVCKTNEKRCDDLKAFSEARSNEIAERGSTDKEVADSLRELTDQFKAFMLGLNK